ncbi:MAG: hypothetical protein HFJ28_07195 [Clostridia bacterium]|nr:hypothetical protein [Clostridia bacterium]
MRKFSVKLWATWWPQYPFRLLFIWLLIAVIAMFTTTLTQSAVLPIAFIILVGLFTFITYQLYISEDKKTKNALENRKPEDYMKKHLQYVDFVHTKANKEDFCLQIADEKWVPTFDNCICSYAPGHRTLSNFDIAACLIYAFLLEECSNEELVFIFKCVKTLISTPKTYNVKYLLGEEIVLEFKESNEAVFVNLPDEQISMEGLLSIFKAYFIPQDANGVSQLSDFLHILYLRAAKQ